MPSIQHKPGDLLICAECGVKIGTGHVMRCLALSQAWKRAGGSATFLLPQGLPGIEERIRVEGVSVQLLPTATPSAKDFVECALNAKPSVVVLDGYSFGVAEQYALSNSGICLLTVDDYGHAGSYPAHAVLNQNAYAQPGMYPGTQAKLLLGPAYTLLRDEFSPWIGWKRQIPDRAQKILITIGGSDPDNLSLQISQTLSLLEDLSKSLEVVFVVGAANPHLDVLTSALKYCAISAHIEQSVRDMPSLMRWADMAIAGAGVTSYELCYMGLPSILLVVAENQRRIAESMSKQGMAVNAGAWRELQPDLLVRQIRALINSPGARSQLSSRSRNLIDGLGSERVRAALLDREITIRRVHEEDCRLLFEWATDPDARKSSFRDDEITWEQHKLWFAERLLDKKSILYIGENTDSEAIGLVRFHVENEVAVLSVNISPKFRGAGWGRELVFFSTRSMFRQHGICRIDAFVKPQNSASVRLFEATGFRPAGHRQVTNQDALVFTLEYNSPA